MVKILITTSSFGNAVIKSKMERLIKEGYSFVFNPYKRKLTQQEVKALIIKEKPDGIIAGTEQLTKDVLSSYGGLKVISRCGIGLDNIDLIAAKELDIRVFNTDSDTLFQSVAELTLGLILDSLHNISFVDRHIRNGQWVRPMGRLLAGKTIGIIGCGKIGTKLATMLKGFDCEIFGFDPNIISNNEISLVSREELLKESDIVSLHLNYNREFYHFVNEQFLYMLKEGTVLVNTARGEFVDEKAVLSALENNKLAVYCADCFESEPYKGELIRSEKVILTSHIGSYSMEARTEMENVALSNLISSLKQRGAK